MASCLTSIFHVTCSQGLVGSQASATDDAVLALAEGVHVIFVLLSDDVLHITSLASHARALLLVQALVVSQALLANVDLETLAVLVGSHCSRTVLVQKSLLVLLSNSRKLTAVLAETALGKSTIDFRGTLGSTFAALGASALRDSIEVVHGDICLDLLVLLLDLLLLIRSGRSFNNLHL